MFFSNQLNNIKNLKHCFFSRKGGVSSGIYSSLNCGLGSKDEKINVLKNLNIISKKMLNEKKIITLNQVHSNKVIYFNSYNDVKDKEIGDAIVTKLSGVAIGTLTADCVPILICDPIKKVIGCIHAGWKGAFNGIIENTVNKFLELNCDEKNLVVAVGPCIDHKSYKVEDDFYKKFISQSKSNEKFFVFLNKKKYLFNIRNYIDSKLIRLGIKNIEHLKMDTFSDKENFFSYRRSIKDNDTDYGRCVSVIIMT